MAIYAHVTAGVVDTVGKPPLLYFDGTRWWDLRTRDPEMLEPLGWFVVTQTTRPADTDTTTYDYSVQLVASVPTEVWTARPWTTAEIAARDTEVQREADRTLVKAIITDLQAEKARCDTVLAKTANQITGGDTKEVARAAKRIADAAIDLARFVKDA